MNDIKPEIELKKDGCGGLNGPMHALEAELTALTDCFVESVLDAVFEHFTAADEDPAIAAEDDWSEQTADAVEDDSTADNDPAQEIGHLPEGGFNHLTGTELEEISDRLELISGGAWELSLDEDCGSIVLSTAEYPIAEFVTGEWGDKFADLRLEDDGAGYRRAVPFINTFAYGRVDEDEALANAMFMRHAKVDMARLLAEVRVLREAAGIAPAGGE